MGQCELLGPNLIVREMGTPLDFRAILYTLLRANSSSSEKTVL